ncbi:hypothetical protein JQ637_46290 [Bradyrhizobium diazoefficiens]|nr:hypothetical protein [Bradyrhizobium diazoefficiens]
MQNPVGPDSLPFSGPTYAVRNVGGQKFYTCGSSISVGNNREAGTLGAIVRDSSAKQYGLTNNHVSGSCSFAPVGLPILAPGIVDVVPGNLSPFTIGFHSVALKMAPGSADNVRAGPVRKPRWRDFRIIQPRACFILSGIGL